MLRNIPIRLRLTGLSMILLTLCCVGLTIILNVSANRMADVIEADILKPSIQLDDKLNEEDMNIRSLIPVSQGARDTFLHQSILYVILIVAFGGGMTYYLSGKALEPLNALSIQMKNRSVHNLSEELPMPQSQDEIADLTCAFNHMSVKLDNAFAMQKRFSQSAAHELRTPLTVLKTKVEVFNKKSNHTREEYDQLLSTIIIHTNRLSEVVKNLLNLTNMDALPLNEEIELRSLLMNVSEELVDLAKSKNIGITILGEECIRGGNYTLLHRAFYNLVENAIKYNVENGAVQIRIKDKEVTITDTGIGVSSELHSLIFEPFFRVDKSRSRQMGGAGLGLAMVKAIVEQHQAQISVSDNPKGGTIFKVKFSN